LPSEAVVALFATTESLSSSPSLKIFLMCRDITDLSFSNKSEI
jgi:hypothetical protein|tara:strand:- start:124 stop:252 length:129 start_codon:yes stop_codon:yes gene_type:complete